MSLQRLLLVEIWNRIFDLLSIKDILRVAQTCAAFKSAVSGYWKKAFNLAKLIYPFISHDKITSFRKMLMLTGGIISGSTALQFLDRAKYEKSDLDVYINHANSAKASAWFIDNGMKRVTRGSETPSPEIDACEGYNGSSEVHIEEFEARNSGEPRTIQLIATNGNPILAVLRFHSCEHVM